MSFIQPPQCQPNRLKAMKGHLVILVQVAVGHLSGLELNELLAVPIVDVAVVGGGQVTLGAGDPLPDGGQAAPHHVLLPHHLQLLPVCLLEA